MSTIDDTDIAGLAKLVGMTGDNIAVAVAVALAESGGNPEAVNVNTGGSADTGLWQINSVHNSNAKIATITNKLGSLKNPVANAVAMRVVYDSQGWNAWVAYSKGKHETFLPRARAAAQHVNVAKTLLRMSTQGPGSGWDISDVTDSIKGLISGEIIGDVIDDAGDAPGAAADDIKDAVVDGLIPNLFDSGAFKRIALGLLGVVAFAVALYIIAKGM